MQRPGKSMRAGWWRAGWWLAGVLVIVAAAGILAACARPGAAPAGTPVAALPTYAPNAGAGATVAQPGPSLGNEAPANAAADPAPNPEGEQPVAQFAPAGANGGASYAAEIVADKSIVVAAQVAGQVLEVTVDVGDPVQAGQVLVRLDGAALDAQRAQALAGLEAAQAQLELLKDPAKQQDIAAAQAGVDAAAAAYERATNGPTDEERRLATAQLKQAEAAVTVAQAGYNRVKDDPNVGMMPQSLQLQQATLAVEAAQAQFDKLMKGATADQIAGAYAQLANARAALKRLQDGARPAQVEAAEAGVHSAENALYLATLQADKATITAPMDGVVSKLQTATGALAAPGAPMLTLLSDEVRVNIQVEETRLPQLAVGQPATLRVDAYPDQVFNGVIAHIAPELDAATRTVQVTIEPQDDKHLLAPGMSATAALANPALVNP